MSSSTISVNDSCSPISADEVNSTGQDFSTPSPDKVLEESIRNNGNDAEQIDGEEEVDDPQVLAFSTPTPKSRDIMRNSWARRSLKIPPTPPEQVLVPPMRWGSFRPGRHSSASTAAALFNSGKLISGSLHSVHGEEGGELDSQSVSSIEEGVIDLDSKVEQLQEQLEQLVEKQSASDQRYTRVKQDNTNLVARIHMLEEQIIELRVRGEEKLEEEMKRNKEHVQRMKRENKLEIENYSIRIHGMEKQHSLLNNEFAELKIQLDQSRENKNRMEKNLAKTQIFLLKEQEEHKKLKEERVDEVDLLSKVHHQEMSSKEEKLFRPKADLSQNDSGMQLQDIEDVFEENPAARIAELEMEIHVLRNKNISVSESFEELQAQMLSKGLEDGRSLLAQNNSLAAEFEAMSEQELRKSLQEQKNLNMQLKNYIDGVLITIMERDPGLLEVGRK